MNWGLKILLWKATFLVAALVLIYAVFIYTMVSKMNCKNIEPLVDDKTEIVDSTNN